jgi:hypothetical protein
MKLLIAITRPRDIAEFLVAAGNLSGHDKLWVNYYHAYMAYKIAKHYFLQHDEYSHLALLADDLIVTQHDIYELLGWSELCEVICGCCNVDLTANRDLLNISTVLPSRSASGRTYRFIRHDDPIARWNGLVAMPFAGTAFIILARNAVKQLSFDNDHRYSSLPEIYGCCQDVMMCNDLNDLNIPLYVDFKSKMHHLKLYDGNWHKLEVGIKEPNCKLERAK